MSNVKTLAGVIGVGAGGGNVAHLLTGQGFSTAALNTTQADMEDINVDVKFTIKGIDGSGKDRNFSASEFKKAYKSFFNDEKVKRVLQNDIIFVVGTGGGGTGTVVSIMTAGFIKNEYPDKIVVIIGLLGSIKEDLISQQNMLEFLSDLENRAAGCPYMLFDNNKVRGRFGDDVFADVNNEVADAIHLLSKEYLVENARSNIDSRDYARLMSFGGLMAVVSVNDLNISVAEESIDLNKKLFNAFESSTAVITKDPEAYAFFMNTKQEVYNRIDTTFDGIQNAVGLPTAGLVFKHLQNYSGNGPEFGVIMTGMASPIERFNLIQRRIEEYEKVKEKAKLPTVDRSGKALKLAGDSKRSETTGTGGGFLDGF